MACTLKPVNAGALQWLSLGILLVFAVLLVAHFSGLIIPAGVLAAILAAHLVVRTFRDLRFGGPEGRRRAPLNALISLVVIALLFLADR